MWFSKHTKFIEHIRPSFTTPMQSDDKLLCACDKQALHSLNRGRQIPESFLALSWPKRFLSSPNHKGKHSQPKCGYSHQSTADTAIKMGRHSHFRCGGDYSQGSMGKTQPRSPKEGQGNALSYHTKGKSILCVNGRKNRTIDMKSV